MSGLVLCVLAAGAAVSAAAVGYVLTPRLARRRARRERLERREQEARTATTWLAVEGRLALDLEGEFRRVLAQANPPTHEDST